jgi:hypothetical protein
MNTLTALLCIWAGVTIIGIVLYVLYGNTSRPGK